MKIDGITLLTILFVGLKLLGYIHWSWWWVLSPLWISWGFVLAVIILVAVSAAIAYSINYLLE